MRQTRRIKKALPKLGQTSLIYIGKQMCEVRKLEIFCCYVFFSYLSAFWMILRKQEAMKEGLYYEIFITTCHFKDVCMCVPVCEWI